MSRKLNNNMQYSFYVQRHITKLHQWLIDEGIKKAKLTNNDYMLNMINNMNGKKCVKIGILTYAQSTLLNDYLEIPKGTIPNKEIFK